MLEWNKGKIRLRGNQGKITFLAKVFYIVYTDKTNLSLRSCLTNHEQKRSRTHTQAV